MKSFRNLPTQPRRDAWVEVNLGAIEENARAIRKLIPRHVSLMAIVKADAYGHGAAMVLPTLAASGVDMAGVASIDEALHLRQAGIKLPILVIGVVPDWAMRAAANDDIQLTIFDPHHLDNLKKAYSQIQKPFKVHVKVDTGMHRIGIDWQQAADFVEECRKHDSIQVEGIFSHLADSHDDAMSAVQLERWSQVCAAIDPLPRYVHISNSGHALMPHAFDAISPLSDKSIHSNSENQPANNPALQAKIPIPPDQPLITNAPGIQGEFSPALNNLARLGIAFFGYGRHPEQRDLSLKPVMSLKARIIHLQDVPAGTGISYSHRYKTPENGRTSRIATVPLGYADGVPRSLSGKIEGLLAGKHVRQVGAITMDQMMFDISNVPEAQLGDTVTLIGRDGATPTSEAIWLDDWAAKAGTIEYELMCALRVRLPKVYTR